MITVEFNGEKKATVALGKLENVEKFVKAPPRSFWAALGRIAKSGVIQNFVEGADLSTGQRWKRKKDGKRSFLTKTKTLRKVVSQSDENGAQVGTNIVYGRIHHFGGTAGRCRRVEIPARPWLTISDDTKKKIANLVIQSNIGI